MTVAELRALIRWADTAPDNDTFWRRLWFAAMAYDTRTRVRIQALVVEMGTVPNNISLCLCPIIDIMRPRRT